VSAQRVACCTDRSPRGACRQACHTGNSCGASRQACHAGGHAGRATQSRAVRESQRHPARMTARFTSSLSLLPICVSSVVYFLRVLRVLCGLFFLCPPFRVRCGAGFLACGRLSSRPWPLYPPPSAQPNAEPCRGGPACPPRPWSMPPGLPHRLPRWSKPPGLPCRRSRRQSTTHATCTGLPNAIRRHDRALHLKPLPSSHLRVLRGLFFSVFSVFSVVCFFCVSSVSSVVCFSPCSLWFVFSVPSISSPLWGRLSSRPCPPYAPPSAQPNAVSCRGGPACPPLLL